MRNPYARARVAIVAGVALALLWPTMQAGADASRKSAAGINRLAGTVRSRAGAPLAGIRVEVYQRRTNPLGTDMVATATTSAEGTYAIGGLSDGPYDYWFYDDSRAFAPRIFSQLGVPVDAFDVALDPTGQIRGTVTYAGLPLSGISVWLLERAWPPSPYSWLPQPSPTRAPYQPDYPSGYYAGRSTVTTRDGTYRFDGLIPDSYFVAFAAHDPSTGTDPLYSLQYYHLASSYMQATKLTLDAGQTLGDIDAELQPSSDRTPKPAHRVSNPVAPSTMSHARFYTVYATLVPQHAEGSHPVRIYKHRRVGGRWRACGYVLARASNYSSYTKCTARMKLTLKGRWRLRAYARADADHSAKWSRGYDYVTVK